MRHLANWASGYRCTARLLVTAAYALVNAAGIWIALLVPADGRIAAWCILAALLLSGGALASYTGRSGPAGFTTRKWRSLAFCFATLLFVSGNTCLQLQPESRTGVAVTAVHAASFPRHASGHRRLSLRDRLVQARQWFSEQSSGVKALLIVGTVLLTLLLIFLWAAICCGIICDGLEALGYFLFVAGTAGAIFGCIRVIQRIVRGPWKRASAS